MQAARKTAAQPSLAERIAQARAEAEAFIDKKALELKQGADGACQPLAALRLMLTQHDTCACRVVMRLLEKN